MVRVSDLLRLQLDLRRAWLSEAEIRGVNAKSFNDCDLVLLGLLAHAFDVTSVAVIDGPLRQWLSAARDAAPGGRDALPIVEQDPSGPRSLLLAPFARAHDPALRDVAARPDRLVVIHGWSGGWSPADWDAAWKPEMTFLPATGIAPALWRSGMQLLLPRARRDEALQLLDRVQAVVNDADLDVCGLLDAIQLLELELRRKDAPQPTSRPAKETDVIAALKSEIAEMRRTAALQQTALAAAYAELANLSNAG